MTDAPELKPCPFCGGGARIYQDPSHSTAWFCGCEDWDCFGNMMWDETKTGATDKWNRRAIPAAARAEALKEALKACDDVFDAATEAGVAVGAHECREKIKAMTGKPK